MQPSMQQYLLGSRSWFSEIVLCVDIITPCYYLHLLLALCLTLGFIGCHSETDRAASRAERAPFASLKGNGCSELDLAVIRVCQCACFYGEELCGYCRWQDILIPMVSPASENTAWLQNGCNGNSESQGSWEKTAV